MLSVLIVDDEEPARLRLRLLLQEPTVPLATVAGEAASAAEALDWLQARRCDVVLLDVQLPGMSGLAMAARLSGHVPRPAVVFVTAHAEHAVAAFELEAVDYLTKPVRRERLEAALQRAARHRAARTGASAEEPGLVVSDRGRLLRVPLSQVRYLKAELKYVTLRTVEHCHVLDESLAELEERFAGKLLRIHRNALVACHAIRALEPPHSLAGKDGGEGWVLRLEGVDEGLAVSRRQLPAVREALRAGSAGQVGGASAGGRSPEPGPGPGAGRQGLVGAR